MFVAEFLAVGKRSAFRSLLGAALRSALGCKKVAAPGGASAVVRGRVCDFLGQRRSQVAPIGAARPLGSEEEVSPECSAAPQAPPWPRAISSQRSRSAVEQLA